MLPLDLELSNEVFAGGTIKGNVCFPVKAEDAASLLIYVEPLFSIDDSRTWFSLNDDTGAESG